MDWSIVQQYLPFYQKAFFLTLHIAVMGIIGSFLLGLVVSVIRHYRVPILSQLSTAYIELSRNTPLLIQLFFLYFGLPRIGLVLSSETCAVVGLIFMDGNLVYAKEHLLSDLPTKNGYNYLKMYVRKDNYLTYNGESHKLVDDKDKSIT